MYVEFKTFLDDGGGVSGIPTSLISIFASKLSFSFVFKASLSIHANESKAGDVHRLSGYLRESPPPILTKSFPLPPSRLPIVC